MRKAIDMTCLTRIADPVLRDVLLRGQIGYQAALLAGDQAWDGGDLDDLPALVHARFPLGAWKGAVHTLRRGPECGAAEFARRAADIRAALLVDLREAGLSVSVEGARAAIGCVEHPDDLATRETTARENIDALARVYSALPVAEKSGVVVYRGTAFGHLDGAPDTRSLGLHRDVFIVGGCDVPDPSPRSGAPNVAWWWARLQPTRRRALAVAERVARSRQAHLERPRPEPAEPNLPDLPPADWEQIRAAFE